VNRAIGSLIVAALIGGAVWIGLTSEPDPVVVFVDDGRYNSEPPTLECSEDDVTYQAEVLHAEGGSGTATPYDAVVVGVKGLLSNDLILRRVGAMAVERHDRTVAVVVVTRTQKGGWLVGSLSSCGKARIGLR
jgi:hypothetical protein